MGNSQEIEMQEMEMQIMVKGEGGVKGGNE